MSDPAAVKKLRAIANDLGEIQHPLAPWFNAALSEYTSGAEHGRTLESALGILPNWWRLERVQRRDELLSEIWRSCFPGHRARAAATQIQSALGRYEATAWRSDRALMRPVKADPLRVRLHGLLKLNVPCGYSTIRAALGVANRKGARLATASETLTAQEVN